MVRNWHTLMPLDPDAGPKVMKKGPESDEAFTRRVMEGLMSSQDLLVINDEAHHAWRVPPKLITVVPLSPGGRADFSDPGKENRFKGFPVRQQDLVYLHDYPTEQDERMQKGEPPWATAHIGKRS